MKDNSKLPELRFKECTNLYDVVKFGDIFTILTTNSLSRDKMNYKNGKVMNIHYGDIHTKFPTILDVQQNKIPFINEDINLTRISQECYCKNGDISIADTSENYDDVGKTIEIHNISNEKILSGLHTYLCRDESGIFVDGYKGFLMNSPSVHNQVRVLATGTKVYGINKPNLVDIQLAIPNKEEQYKVADLLLTVDKKISNQKEQIEKLENVKKGYMQKIFSQEIRFRDDEGNKFPKWEKRKLKEITEVYDGTHQTPRYTDSGIKFLSVEDINAITKSNKYISEEDFKKEFKVYPEKGDILMTRIGDIGTSTLIENNSEKYAYYVSLALLKTSLNQCIYPSFINQYISSDYFQRELHKRVLHVAFPKKINKGDIGECHVYIPASLIEQEKIADFLSTFDKKIQLQKEVLEHWKQIKKGLLHKMFV